MFTPTILGSDEMCQCGCRGWCSLHPLLEAWVSDLQALETAPLVRYAVLDIQGDWPAFLQVFGLRYWSHNTHPCPLCRIDQNQLQELTLNHTTVDSMPFEQYTTSDYLQDLDQSVNAPWIPTKCFQKCLVTNGLFCYPQSLPNKWN